MNLLHVYNQIKDELSVNLFFGVEYTQEFLNVCEMKFHINSVAMLQIFY